MILLSMSVRTSLGCYLHTSVVVLPLQHHIHGGGGRLLEGGDVHGAVVELCLAVHLLDGVQGQPHRVAQTRHHLGLVKAASLLPAELEIWRYVTITDNIFNPNPCSTGWRSGCGCWWLCPQCPACRTSRWRGRCRHTPGYKDGSRYLCISNIYIIYIIYLSPPTPR